MTRILSVGDTVKSTPCVVTIAEVGTSLASGMCQTCLARHTISVHRYEAGEGPWHPVDVSEKSLDSTSQTGYTEPMTNQINYRSKEWAEDVASRLDDARVHVAAAASALRSVAADMDADGKDVERGPHAPPIQDVQSLLNIATSLLAMQTSNWQGYAFHRPETTL